MVFTTRQIRLSAFGRAAVGSAPVIALAAKREDEGAPEAVVLRGGIRGNSNFDGGLGNVLSERSVQFIPPAKDDAEIGIRFALHLRMMDAVHSRGGQHAFKIRST